MTEVTSKMEEARQLPAHSEMDTAKEYMDSVAADSEKDEDEETLKGLWTKSALLSSALSEVSAAEDYPAFESTSTSSPAGEFDPEAMNDMLSKVCSEEIVKWAASHFGDGLAVTTSFGIQSAATLHMVTRILPDVPVIWVDTGYFPAETYTYAETLTKSLNLNLKVYQSRLSPARMEAIYGKLYEKPDVASMKLYNQIRKVEPLQRALRELRVTAWIAGLRRAQTDFRRTLPVYSHERSQAKIMPILDWSSRDVAKYLKMHHLPKHPLEEKGYVSVGDWHSSRPLSIEDLNERDTRFQGLLQECGIHTSDKH